MKTVLSIIFLGLTAVTASADPAKDLAAKLSAVQQDGSSFVRLKLDTKPTGGTLQLQIKQRRGGNSIELVYQVLWPKERAGEAVLLKQTGNDFSGSVFTPPNTVRPLTAAQIKESLFGSALSYADVLENFFAWDDQKIVGEETIDRVKCQILESRAGKSQQSGTAMVRSWIDTRRMVPMKVEKFQASGAPSRRIETNQVVTDDLNRNIPAFLTIQNFEKNTVTVLDGSKLRHGVKFADREFKNEGLGELKPPAAE
jgi:hypothetical protein